MAVMKPPQGALTTGVVAYAQSDVLVADCSSQLASDAPASVTGLTLTKGRVLRWAVDVQTEPPVNGTFLGESLVVMTTWQQRSEPGLRLNVSGQVAVKGSAAVNKAQVRRAVWDCCRPSCCAAALNVACIAQCAANQKGLVDW